MSLVDNRRDVTLDQKERAVIEHALVKISGRDDNPYDRAYLFDLAEKVAYGDEQ